MTDSEPDLTPEEEARVRRLLADARHDEPMPPDVVARLEGVLAGLADETRVQEAPGATVTALATRRRRAARMLVAAAAVVAVGIGLGQVVDLGGTSADDAGAPAADSEVAQESASPEEAAPRSGGYSSNSDAQVPSADVPVVTIRRQAFAKGARLAQDYSSGALDTRSELYGGSIAGLKACRTDEWGAGTLVPVRYGRAPAVLVLRRPSGETQVADLFLCGETDPVRSVTLPAP